MKAALGLIGVLSVVIIVFLFWLIYFQESVATQRDWSFLPASNAIMNALSALCVTYGIVAIKKQRKLAHGVAMAMATGFSALFLLGYVLHHTYNGDTLFHGEGVIRVVYFTILISHILLSIAVVPMILTTLFLAVTRKFTYHKKVARFTYPVWLYVSVTGVIVFVFLRFLNEVPVAAVGA